MMLDLGLESALRSFPTTTGEIMGATVDTYSELTPQQIKDAEYDEA